MTFLSIVCVCVWGRLPLDVLEYMWEMSSGALGLRIFGLCVYYRLVFEWGRGRGQKDESFHV